MGSLILRFLDASIVYAKLIYCFFKPKIIDNNRNLIGSSSDDGDLIAKTVARQGQRSARQLD